jgi:hypothetical protein
MSYGFSLKNANQELLVSDQFAGLHFLGRATLVSGSLWRIASTQRILAFVRTNGTQYACIDSMFLSSPGNWDIQVRGTAMEVLCFTPLTTTTPATPWGTQVFNQAGACMFDSTRKPLILRQVIPLNTQPASGLVSVNVVAGLSQPAFCLLSGGYYRTFEYGNFTDIYRESFVAGRINNGQLQFGMLAFYTVNHNHQFEADLMEPVILEDQWMSSVIAIIDASQY